MLVSQRIPHLSGGVSQLPAELRSPTQMEALSNALPTLGRGLRKRPSTRHVAKLDASNADWGGAFKYLLDFDDQSRFRAVVRQGVLKVFDAVTGVAVPVYTEGGAADYLADGSRGFSAVTAGNKSWLVNRAKYVQHTTERTARSDGSALLWVRAADHGVRYTVNLAGVSAVHEVAVAQDPTDKAEVGTDKVAERIIEKMLSFPAIADSYLLGRFGSVIHIKHKNGGNFALSTSDGLADRGLVVANGAVQSFEDLPPTAPFGYVVRVSGIPGESRDDQFVRYEVDGYAQGGGTWRECAASDIHVALDPKSMPHLLERNGSLFGETQHRGNPFGPGWGIAEYAFTSEQWDKANGLTALTESDRATLTDTYKEAEVTLDIVKATGHHRLVVGYSVDLTRLPAGSKLHLQLYHAPAGTTTWSKIAERYHDTGENAIYSMQVDRDLAPNDNLKIAASVSAGTDWVVDLPMKRTAPDGTVYEASVRVGAPSKAYVRINEQQELYPSRTAITLETSGGYKWTYTTGGADETAQQVAEGLRLLVEATTGFDTTAKGNGEFWMFEAPTYDVPFIPTNVVWGWNTSHWAHLPKAGLANGSLVNLTLKNLTTGASGAITENSESVIKTGGLTGGSRGTIEAGDRLEVLRTDATYFVLRPGKWDKRGAGDELTNPWPSFLNRQIREAFVHQGRLGFVHGQSVALSAVGSHGTFFRTTTTQLLDSDVIDVSSAHNDASAFHSAVPWNGKLYLFSERAQYVLEGEPVLTPKSVSLLPVSHFSSSPKVRPVAYGSKLLFMQVADNRVRLVEYSHPPYQQPRVDDLTEQVPDYIPLSPMSLAVDERTGLVFVLVSYLPNAVCVCALREAADGRRTQLAWNVWDFPAGTKVHHVDFGAGKLGLLTTRSDGAHLETIDLKQGG